MARSRWERPSRGHSLVWYVTPLLRQSTRHSWSVKSGCGGQICVFLSSLPNWGPGALKSREDPLLYGTDKEKSLYSPSIPFWRNTAEELAEAGVGVNTFLFPERYIDAASVGECRCDLEMRQ